MTKPQWDRYIALDWTSEQDKCEAEACEKVMGSDSYYGSEQGNYCSEDCADSEESFYSSYCDDYEDFGADMGVGVSDPYEPWD